MKINYWLKWGMLASVVMGVLLIFMNSSFMYSKSISDEIVYVDNRAIFEQFELKKDLDKLIEKDLFTETAELQKMEINLKSATHQTKELQEAYVSLKNQIRTKFEALSQQYTNQVYERMNAYLEEYGKQKHIRMIVGASGQGNVLFVEKGADVTKEVINFMNTKYLDK